MLRAAINYKDQLNSKIAHKALKGELVDYGMNGYNILKVDIKDDNWNSFQFVSVCVDEVIGYISFTRKNPGNIIENIGIVSFTNSDYEISNFASDCYTAIKRMFTVFKVDSIHFSCMTGSVTERHYDSFVEQLGGVVVGIQKRFCMDETNIYRDVKNYQILKEDFKTVMKGGDRD